MFDVMKPPAQESPHRWAFETLEGVEHGHGLGFFHLANMLGQRGWRFHDVDDFVDARGAVNSGLSDHIKGLGSPPEISNQRYWVFEKAVMS